MRAQIENFPHLLDISVCSSESSLNKLIQISARVTITRMSSFRRAMRNEPRMSFSEFDASILVKISAVNRKNL